MVVRAFAEKPFLTYELFNHNTDQIIVYITPLLGPSVVNTISLKMEKQAPASRIHGTSHVSSAELVSRKRTRKVGPGRFIHQYRKMISTHERVIIIGSVPT